MRFPSWIINGLLSMLAVTLTAAALATGGLHSASAVSQKIITPRADMQPAVAMADGTQKYIVQFSAAPTAIYVRSTAFLMANPSLAKQHFLNIHSPAVQAYVAQLNIQHAQFLDAAAQIIGHNLKPRFDYHYALNGMALRLTPGEAARLRRLPGVKSLRIDRAFKPVTGVPIPGTAAYTFPSRSWIGADSVWTLPTFNTGVGATPNDNEGEGIVVADLDTGINAANSSFAADGPDGYSISDPLGSNNYLGVCDPNNASDGTLVSGSPPQAYQSGFPCNNKLIGAYTYTIGSNDPASPQDSEGHGSHTMSIAAGNYTVTNIAGINFNVSGMAPHANIIAYDVCDTTDQCLESASVAAVDQAIQDYSTLKAADPGGFKGMVLNYSIGGSDDPYQDPVDQAFEAAEQAGIFVSAAAGNGGPENPSNSVTPGSQYPVQHLAPWLMTVGASTHDGQFGPNGLSGFTGGTNPSPPSGSISGQGATGAYGPDQIIYAGSSTYTYSAQYYSWLESNYSSQTYSQSGETYPQPSGDAAADAAQCFYPFAVPSGQAFSTPQFPVGAIVLCDRGTIALVDKADNVKQGQAGGVVIATTSSSSQQMVAEQYDIPGLLVDTTDGDTLRAWIIGNPTDTLQAQITGASYMSGDTADADYVAGFSSRGPIGTYPASPSPFDSLIKPDVVVPGVSVLAAYADPCYTFNPPTCPDGLQENFTFLNGTSMATPHSAGAGALLMELHPTWDPMAVKSALMTTAVTDANLHDQCDAANASANGCTVTEPEPPTPQSAGAGRIQVNVAARAGFVLEESQVDFDAANPDNGGDPTKLNLPSLGNADCQESCSWTRTLTSTQTGASLNYSASTTESWITVSPGSFTLAPGGTQTLTITADMSGLSVNQWAFAEVDFTGSSNEDDGQPAPLQHFPVAVYNQQPEPKMSVTPSSLSQSLTAGGSSQTQQITIGNTGLGALNWSINNIASPSANTSNALMGVDSGQVIPRAGGNLLPIVNRPYDNSGYGYPSDFFTADGHGIYSSDTFTMPVAGSVEVITALGFAQSGQSAGALSDATQIVWYVYADANGAPAGNPEDGKQDYIWSFTAAPAATGVDTTNNNISLDLTSAGAPILDLAAGKYWLIVAPTFNDNFNNFSGEAWYWFESTAGGGLGSIIDPGNLLAQPAGQELTSWTELGPNTSVDANATGSAQLAFEVEGTLNCSNNGNNTIPGLSLSASNGTVAPNKTGTVTATFNPTSLNAGSYAGVLCVLGNDPNTPYVVVPVTESVAAAPTPPAPTSSSSKGGGGGSGLLGLLMLSILYRARVGRRKIHGT
jgi:Subtilase family/PA domain/Viral BACON domain